MPKYFRFKKKNAQINFRIFGLMQEKKKRIFFLFFYFFNFFIF